MAEFVIWANTHGLHGMRRPEELEAEGWVDTGRRHHLYPSSILMKRKEVVEMAVGDMEFARLQLSENRTVFIGEPPAEIFITPELIGHGARHGVETIITIDGHNYRVIGYDNLNRALKARKVESNASKSN